MTAGQKTAGIDPRSISDLRHQNVRFRHEIFSRKPANKPVVIADLLFRPTLESEAYIRIVKVRPLVVQYERACFAGTMTQDPPVAIPAEGPTF